jgi:pimeloyl-ACP methyl ester carboxylesterase
MSLLAHHRITAAATQQMKSKHHNIRCPLSSSYNDQLRRSISSSPPLQKLAHEWISNGKVVSSSPHNDQDNKQQTIVFLHGLLGNAKNLRTPAKKLTRQLPNISALLLDVRGHGGSSSSSGNFVQPHNFQSCVQDIFDTLTPLGLIGASSPIAICGHSLGGRIALQYTHSLQQQKQKNDFEIQMPKQTWILDSVPGTPDPSVHKVLKAISSIPLPISCKSTLTQTLISEYKMNKAIAMWIASNLKEGDSKDGFEWVFDLNVANELVDNFADQNFVDMVHEITSDAVVDSKVQLVMAGRNKEWREEIISSLKSVPNFGETKESLFRMHKLEEAGHWVHVDAVNELTQLMVDELLHTPNTK